MSHTILKPTFVRQDERGIFREVLNTGEWKSIIQGEATSGAVLGNHYHEETEIFFFLLSGSAKIVTEHSQSKARDEFELHAMQGVILATFESHAITFLEASHYLLLKSQKYDPKAPDTYHYPVV